MQRTVIFDESHHICCRRLIISFRSERGGSVVTWDKNVNRDLRGLACEKNKTAAEAAASFWWRRSQSHFPLIAASCTAGTSRSETKSRGNKQPHWTVWDSRVNPWKPTRGWSDATWQSSQNVWFSLAELESGSLGAVALPLSLIFKLHSDSWLCWTVCDDKAEHPIEGGVLRLGCRFCFRDKVRVWCHGFSDPSREARRGAAVFVRDLNRSRCAGRLCSRTVSAERSNPVANYSCAWMRNPKVAARNVFAEVGSIVGQHAGTLVLNERFGNDTWLWPSSWKECVLPWECLYLPQHNNSIAPVGHAENQSSCRLFLCVATLCLGLRLQGMITDYAINFILNIAESFCAKLKSNLWIQAQRSFVWNANISMITSSLKMLTCWCSLGVALQHKPAN